MTERWETIEAVDAARAEMEAALGWERPAAWGLLTPDGAVVRANVRGGYLPGVALATVVGYRSGSVSYPLSASVGVSGVGVPGLGVSGLTGVGPGPGRLSPTPKSGPPASQA